MFRASGVTIIHGCASVHLFVWFSEGSEGTFISMLFILVQVKTNTGVLVH